MCSHKCNIIHRPAHCTCNTFTTECIQLFHPDGQVAMVWHPRLWSRMWRSKATWSLRTPPSVPMAKPPCGDSLSEFWTTWMHNIWRRPRWPPQQCWMHAAGDRPWTSEKESSNSVPEVCCKIIIATVDSLNSFCFFIGWSMCSYYCNIL